MRERLRQGITYTNEGEGRVHKGSEEAQEVTSRTGDAVVINPGTRVIPVAEANGLVVGTSAGGDDDGGEDEADEAEDLDGAAHDLGLAVPAHAEQVAKEDEGEGYRDDDGGCYVCPIRHQNCGRGSLGTDGDCVAVAV